MPLQRFIRFLPNFILKGFGRNHFHFPAHGHKFHNKIVGGSEVESDDAFLFRFGNQFLRMVQRQRLM